MNVEDIPQDALQEHFIRASGPGGQHVNKTSSAVQLRVNTYLLRERERVRQRLLKLAGQRATREGYIVIEVQDTRSQARNRDIALERLAAMIEAARVEPKVRKPTKISRAAKERRRQSKAHRSSTKAQRRKPNLD